MVSQNIQFFIFTSPRKVRFGRPNCLFRTASPDIARAALQKGHGRKKTSNGAENETGKLREMSPIIGCEPAVSGLLLAALWALFVELRGESAKSWKDPCWRL